MQNAMAAAATSANTMYCRLAGFFGMAAFGRNGSRAHAGSAKAFFPNG
jgi:hypothetical protein